MWWAAASHLTVPGGEGGTPADVAASAAGGALARYCVREERAMVVQRHLFCVWCGAPLWPWSAGRRGRLDGQMIRQNSRWRQPGA